MSVPRIAVLVGAAHGFLFHGNEQSASGRGAGDDAQVGFIEFMQTHQRSYGVGSQEYHKRFALYKEQLDAVSAHNSQAGRTWTAAVNAFSDYTKEELGGLTGYRHMARTGSSRSVAFAGVASKTVHMTQLPKNFTWQGQLTAMRDVVNQGTCGSCWAVSSATTLQAHAELYSRHRTFSSEQIVACTPNPLACGGTGGCKGATAELALEYAAKYGIVTAEHLPYKGGSDSCPVSMKPIQQSNSETISLPDISASLHGGMEFGMTGLQKLPENKAESLLQALYQKGPVVVSVAAGGGWFMYSSGIMQCVQDDVVINHAVTLVGFGEEGPRKFWTIQNSWGPKWGESGFVRIARSDSEQEDLYCAWDKSPKEGTGCKGGPSKVWVCGHCGILYDTVVPEFTLSSEGLFSRRNRSASGILVQEGLGAHLRR